GDRFGEALLRVVEGPVQWKDAVALDLLECETARLEQVAQRRGRHLAPPGCRRQHPLCARRRMQRPGLQDAALQRSRLLLETLQQRRPDTVMALGREE